MTPEKSEQIFKTLDQELINEKIHLIHNTLDIYMEEQGQVEIKEIKLLIPNDLIKYNILQEFKNDEESVMILWDWLRLKKGILDAKDEKVFLRIGKRFEFGFNYIIETSMLELRQEQQASEMFI